MGNPVSKSSGNTDSGNHDKRGPSDIAIIAMSLFMSGALLLAAALVGTEAARVEHALAAFFLAAFVLVLPGLSEITIGAGSLSLRLAQAQKDIERTRSAQLLGQAVWRHGDFWFITAEGRFGLPDHQTARFLASRAGVLRDVELDELDAFPPLANLNSALDAKYLTAGIGNRFLLFAGDDNNSYKAYIGSMSALADLGRLEDPPEEVKDLATLASYITLR